VTRLLTWSILLIMSVVRISHCVPRLDQVRSLDFDNVIDHRAIIDYRFPIQWSIVDDRTMLSEFKLLTRSDRKTQ
jgi:hypothetical protein